MEAKSTARRHAASYTGLDIAMIFVRLYLLGRHYHTWALCGPQVIRIWQLASAKTSALAFLAVMGQPEAPG